MKKLEETPAIVIVAPMPPSVTNASGRSRHWRTAHAERNAYWFQLDQLQLLGKIPAPPPQPIPRASVRSLMRLGGAMDDDNAIARHKRLLDWLVSRGYLAGDRRTHLRWEALPDQVVKRTGDYSITLTITPIPLEP